MTIVLREITSANWRDTLRLGVSPEQQHFVAGYAPIAAIMLAKAYIRPDDLHWLPFAMYADEVLVGLVELACDPASQSNYWMYHFFIDAAHQGKGYGRQCLRAFVDNVRATYPNCEQLYLTVNSANLVAQRLYASVGFHPTGEFRHDEPVYMLRVRE